MTATPLQPKVQKECIAWLEKEFTKDALQAMHQAAYDDLGGKRNKPEIVEHIVQGLTLENMQKVLGAVQVREFLADCYNTKCKTCKEAIQELRNIMCDVPDVPDLKKLKLADDYDDLTNEEEFRLMALAKTVHIISTPYTTNKLGAKKAAATKDFHDNRTAGVYVFNPNTGLAAAGAYHQMNEEKQDQMWLKIWTDVAKKVKSTGGKCFVMAKGTGPHDRRIEGKAQQGEIGIAELGQIPIEYVYY